MRDYGGWFRLSRWSNFFIFLLLAQNSQALPEIRCPSDISDFAIPHKVLKLGGAATSLEFSPDSQTVLVGLNNGQWLEVDADDAKIVRSGTHGDKQTFVGYLGKGEPLSVGSDKRAIMNGQGVYCCSTVPVGFASSGQFFAVVTNKRAVELVDAETFKKVRTLSIPPWWKPARFSPLVSSVAFSPKGDKLAVAYYYRGKVDIIAYSTKNGEVLHAGEIAQSVTPDLTGQWNPIRSPPVVSKLAFAADGETVIAAYRSYLDSKSDYWIGQVFFIPIAHPEKMTSIISVATSSANYMQDTLDLHVAPGGEALVTAHKEALGPPYSIGYQYFISGSLPRATIYQEKGGTFVPSLSLVGHFKEVTLARLGQGGRVATVGGEDRLVLWNVEKALSTGQPIGVFDGIMPVAVTPFDSGLGFPGGHIFGMPPDLIWARGQRGRIIDEALGPFFKE